MKERNLKFLNSLPEGLSYDVIDSPVGELVLIASDKGLYFVSWKRANEMKIIQGFKKNAKNPIIVKAKKQLREYFKGNLKKFDLPLISIGTDFQKKAWKTLSRIPYGKTISYKEQAIKLGDKNKMRAVGGANGRNPHSIIVPCHRVIAQNGNLQGFGGGLKRKQTLLELEQKFN